jgi:arylsulfatase A-like enzyme
MGQLSRRTFVAGAAGAASNLAMPAIARARRKKHNVLFIVIDDMNDFCSVLGGYPGMVTPNMERLNAMGVTFMNAMAHVPACSPARSSVLLGSAAYNSGVYFNSESWEDSPVAIGHETLVGQLHANGYKTFGTGKVFHKVDQQLRPEDWDEYFLTVDWEASRDDLGHIVSQLAQDEWNKFHRESPNDFGPGRNGGRADKDHATWAAQKIAETFPEGGSFVACGFFRPHLPLVVPAEFINLYPRSPANPPGFYPGAVRFEDNEADLSDVSKYAIKRDPTSWGPKLEVHDEYRAFLRAYLGSISFVDHSLGILLDAIEAGPFQENTFIVLWSDHGWQLGEKLGFTKFTLWERALRVPLMFAGPNISPRALDFPVSLIDIYPTLCELLKLPVPEQCDGQSLKGLLKYGYPAHRKYVVSLWGNEKVDDRFKVYSSVRTGRYRYIDYGANGFPELYDHKADPFEWNNLIEGADPALVQSLQSLLPTKFADPLPRHPGNGGLTPTNGG